MNNRIESPLKRAVRLLVADGKAIYPTEIARQFGTLTCRATQCARELVNEGLLTVAGTYEARCENNWCIVVDYFTPTGKGDRVTARYADEECARYSRRIDYHTAY